MDKVAFLHSETIGRPFPKAWIIGKTLKQITNDKPKTKTK
jgi:hypothetical protein